MGKRKVGNLHLARMGWGLIIVLGGAPFLGMASIQALKTSQVALRWSAVPARVLSKRLAVSEAEEGPWYRPIIRYEYTAQGRRYVSEQYHVLTMESSPEPGPAERLLANFEIGLRTTAYINPSNPAEAVLDKSLAFQGSLLVFGWVAGLWALFWRAPSGPRTQEAGTGGRASHG